MGSRNIVDKAKADAQTHEELPVRATASKLRAWD